MSTSTIDNASTAIQNIAKELLIVFAKLAIVLTIGIIGTFILDPGTQQHYAFAAVLLVGAAIWF